jgi:hypothetical protein
MQTRYLLVSLPFVAVKAFVIPHHVSARSSSQSLVFRRMSSTEEKESDSGNNANDSVLMQPDGVVEGSHAELMYTLGVNLARQLGDVRPLVENGEELAQVAKGVLDTVIGRLAEDGQRALLSRRGAELNQLIKDRA